MKKTLLFAVCALLCGSMAFATTTESAASDKTDAAKTQTEGKKKKQVQYNEKGEIIKTGINLGPLPVVAFDADRGFQFGALMNIYDFGNGKNYPNPDSQWYFEGSAYLNEGTVGSFLARAEYDNKTLIPGVRMSVCAGYYRDAALDFYGFNGSQSIYDNQLKTGFYRFSRDLIRLKADFTGKILKNFYWEAGYNFNCTFT